LSKKWYRRAPVALLALTSAVALMACGSSESTGGSAGTSTPATSNASTAPVDTSGSGGTLRIGLTAGNIPFPNTPPNEGFEGRRFVGYQIYDGLYRWNTWQGDTVPEPELALAESFTISEDRLTWTFKLRQDVVFHDGTTFDADDTIFQFRRIKDRDFEYYDANLASTNGSAAAAIVGWEKIDQYTIAITTRTPNAFLPYDLTYIYFPSPEVVMRVGNDNYIKEATGTGPFKMTRYVDGQVMELEAFEQYWDGRPSLDKVILYPMPEAATRLAALQAGDIDWAELPPPDSMALLEAGGFQVFLKEYPHVITYQLNTYEGSALSDVRVRQALNYAADREGTSILVNGVGFPASQYMYPGHPWFDEAWEGYTYDPDKAKALLAEAGYADGLTLKMIYPTGGSGNMFPGPMNEKLKQDFAAVGINLDLIPIEWNNILTALREGFANPAWSQYDMSYISLAPVAPTGFRSYVGAYIPPNGCCNQSGYATAATDALYFQAQETFDKAEQDRLLKEFHSTMMKDAPVLVTIHDLNLRVMSPKVKGFVQPQSWFVDLRKVWIDN
jgi:peptide/nickel transport system substrate-binding protein